MVKLRLRGKGSGFKEGPKQEESNDPLHLCISSRFYDKYLVACNHVQELIMNVYEEYKRYCEKNKKEPRQELSIKKIETVTGRRSVPQQPPQIFTPINGQ
jgi:phage host-nuclease inhibitor protein Gam